MSVSTHHIVSGFTHDEFNPVYHSGLYISLKNISGCNWLREIHPQIGVPNFLYIAMESLKYLIWQQEKDIESSFINLILNTNIRHPTPFNPNCRICQRVDYLLKKCKQANDALKILTKEDTITMFEINRELWTRIHPKPLYITKTFLKYVESIDYPMALLSPDFRYPLSLNETHKYDLLRKQFYLHEWRNGFSYLLHRDLNNKGENYANTAGYILSNMLIIILNLTSEFFNDELDVAESHYLLEKLRRYPRTRDILLMMSKVVGMAICELEEAADFEQILESNFLESDLYKSKLTKCISTIMCLNNIAVFKPDWPIWFSFTHIPDCPTQSHLCFCRFPYLLEKQYIKPRRASEPVSRIACFQESQYTKPRRASQPTSSDR